jgi:hypothetical protein
VDIYHLLATFQQEKQTIYITWYKEQTKTSSIPVIYCLAASLHINLRYKPVICCHIRPALNGNRWEQKGSSSTARASTTNTSLLRNLINLQFTNSCCQLSHVASVQSLIAWYKLCTCKQYENWSFNDQSRIRLTDGKLIISFDCSSLDMSIFRHELHELCTMNCFSSYKKKTVADYDYIHSLWACSW